MYSWNGALLSRMTSPICRPSHQYEHIDQFLCRIDLLFDERLFKGGVMDFLAMRATISVQDSVSFQFMGFCEGASFPLTSELEHLWHSANPYHVVHFDHSLHPSVGFICRF